MERNIAMNQSDKRGKALRVAALGVWAALILFVLLHRREITLEKILSYTPQSPILAAVAMMGLFALKSLSLVMYSGLLYAASGSLFPIPLAILVNICGTVVMASVHFFPARRIGAVRVGELREKYPKLKAVEDFRGKNDFAFSLLLRAMQVVNFDIGSMYMGAAGLRTLPFLLGSAAGKMTDIILFPIMGASIGDARFAPFWITVAVDLLIALLTFLWVKQKSRKSKESSIHEKTCR